MKSKRFLARGVRGSPLSILALLCMALVAVMLVLFSYPVVAGEARAGTGFYLASPHELAFAKDGQRCRIGDTSFYFVNGLAYSTIVVQCGRRYETVVLAPAAPLAPVMNYGNPAYIERVDPDARYCPGPERYWPMLDGLGSYLPSIPRLVRYSGAERRLKRPLTRAFFADAGASTCPSYLSSVALLR